MSLAAARRFRYTVGAGSAAVALGAGFIVMGLGRQASADPRPADVPLAAPASPSVVPVPSVTTTPASPSPSPSVTKKSTRPSPSTTPKKVPVTTKVSTQSPDEQVVEQVLAHLNAARKAEGLSALKLDDDLSKASTLHNKLMINGCGLSHQCSGEGDIGKRFTAQGVEWGSAGENIGYGSSGSSASAIIKAANGLTDSMLAEVAPNDGHRKNLLSKSFTRIGLSIVRDSKGVTWMTQDFVG
ncbi:CAP domain-containing protein [Actinoplanes sp. NPDC020271]|uniref:CAP domain-containing protein n=1 Tax=Actinoplanes sp. NPDC020271 TaxID=3363896 RepID=UPI0037B0B7FB